MKIFTESEEIIYKLRELYEKYGYRRFKMSKFEEYDFYMEYKKFLTTQNIISFNDLDGSLLALKPDITLSIAKNAKEGENTKVYYNENVYRVSHNIHEYKEIPQMGIEYIGDVDIYAECEILRLAHDSVEEIAKTAFAKDGEYTYSLDISHMGFVSALLAHYGVSEGTKQGVLESLGKKDSEGIRTTCLADGVPAEGAEKIASLAEFHGSWEGLAALSVCEETEKIIEELKIVMSTLGADNVKIDFSIVNDMSYYNGIVFQGFVQGIPRNVLSGGRYGNLLAKMGKNASACGFALYLDLIDLYRESEEHFDADIVVLYEDASSFEKISAIEEAANFYRENGFRVVVAKKGSVLPKAKKIIEFDGEKEVLV
ncbi:MAG: ATP phosphoribosyltransferase regulatory subunit [Clostridia bacterium]|nr:ATP phosphoribosyltransferase regulatory subunit [Clostridia bacterium]